MKLSSHSTNSRRQGRDREEIPDQTTNRVRKAQPLSAPQPPVQAQASSITGKEPGTRNAAGQTDLMREEPNLAPSDWSRAMAKYRQPIHSRSIFELTVTVFRDMGRGLVGAIVQHYAGRGAGARECGLSRTALHDPARLRSRVPVSQPAPMRLDRSSYRRNHADTL